MLLLTNRLVSRYNQVCDEGVIGSAPALRPGQHTGGPRRLAGLRDETDPLRAGLVSLFLPPAQSFDTGCGTMSNLELFILAVGLAMDAFAVAVCKGLSIRTLKLRQALLVGLWFGLFQALMPALGWLLGSAFSELVQSVDHWIAFLLLAIIGGNMIREALHGDEEDVDPSLSFGVMFLLAVATSIDALAVGITFAFLSVNILAAVAFIGVITFAISAVGVKLGNLFGARYKSKAEFFGGAVLILIGLKILLEHLGVLSF